MHKVMTRAQLHRGTRPPGRRDTRRPGGAPPRDPGAGTAGAQAPGGRPPGSPGDRRATRRLPEPEGAARHAPPAAATRTSAPTATATATATAGTVPPPRPSDVFADLLLAVLSGQRPVHAMLRHTAGRAYDELVRLAERGPLRTTRGVRPVVRDIGYYEPRPGVLEVFARIGAGDRLRAMAFRLERGPNLRWRCTAVELGGPRRTRPHGG
ncbi:Rv3235 family protein [Streptomyces sp. MS06]|uniref:Rv3235 family protein n=1 Tax=Streptomyces sp. MS06 TaxID=3385974 RepID=UPI0039A2D71A